MDRMIYLSMSGAKAALQRQDSDPHTFTILRSAPAEMAPQA